MGSCCSSEEDTVSQDGDINERTRLLSDPVSSNYHINPSSVDYGNHYSSSATKKSDEQTALNRILQQTASDIIDVGALECHTLEQHEYLERVRAYNQRLTTLPHKTASRSCPEVRLLSDVSAADRILSSQPISLADLNLIVSSAEKVVAALAHIRVEHREDLVVAFGVP